LLYEYFESDLLIEKNSFGILKNDKKFNPIIEYLNYVKRGKRPILICRRRIQFPTGFSGRIGYEQSIRQG